MAAQELEITIVSAKHLKNVNWKYGDLQPYAMFWLHTNKRLTTKTDKSNSIKPVWNEHFVIPILSDSSSAPILKLLIYHAKASHTHVTQPMKPLVGNLRFPLSDLRDPGNSNLIRSFDMIRPSGRPNGKIRLKLAIRERPLPPPEALRPLIVMTGGSVDTPVPGQLQWRDNTIPLIKPPHPEDMPPEASYPRPISSNYKSSASKVKDLESDDKSAGQLAESRWYYKLKKLLLVCHKKRKGPVDPLVEGLVTYRAV